jgi:hypothetical protein
MLIILILLGIGVLLAAGVYVWRRLNEHRCLAQHHTQLLSSRGGAEGDQRDRLAYPRSGASWHAGPAPQGPPGGGYYYRRLKTSVDESAAATAAVQITVARIRIDDRSRSAPAGRGGRQQPGGAQFSHASAWPGGRAPIVIERRAEFVHPKPGETVGQLIRRCETRLREEEVGAASTFVGDKVSESVWNYVARGWITVREPFDQVVAASRQLEAGIHELLLGRPVELAGRVCGLSSPETRVAGALTSAAPIDLVDRSLGLG